MHSSLVSCSNVSRCLKTQGTNAYWIRVLPDDELILVLVKLVEYLGHESAVVSAAAFTEASRHGTFFLCLMVALHLADC